MRRALAAALLASALATPAWAARVVVVVPLDASGTEAFQASRVAMRQILVGLRDMPDVRVMESQAVTAELGVNLVEQVQLCRHEVLCLVQIGEAVTADFMLLGDLVVKDGKRSVKLYVVDVTKAAMVDTMSWTVTDDDRMLEDAMAVAVRQLFSKPDARVVFEVSPKDAHIDLYGERADLKLGEEIPYWSGVYYGRVYGKGYVARDVRIVLPAGGPTRVVIELDPDLLYVDPDGHKRARDGGKFAVLPPGSETATPKAAGPSPFANLWAWGMVAVGAGAGAVGGLVMVGAQSDYNDLSGEPRFLRGTTTTSLDAIAERDDARSRFGLGSKVMIGGIVVGTAGLVWMLVDAAISGGGTGGTAAVTVAPQGGASCAWRF